MTYKELLLEKNDLENKLKIIKGQLKEKEQDIQKQLMDRGILKFNQEGMTFEIKNTTKLDGKKPELVEFIMNDKADGELRKFLKATYAVNVADLKKERKDIYDNFAENTTILKVEIEEVE